MPAGKGTHIGRLPKKIDLHQARELMKVNSLWKTAKMLKISPSVLSGKLAEENVRNKTKIPSGKGDASQDINNTLEKGVSGKDLNSEQLRYEHSLGNRSSGGSR